MILYFVLKLILLADCKSTNDITLYGFGIRQKKHLNTPKTSENPTKTTSLQSRRKPSGIFQEYFRDVSGMSSGCLAP